MLGLYACMPNVKMIPRFCDVFTAPCCREGIFYCLRATFGSARYRIRKVIAWLESRENFLSEIFAFYKKNDFET